MHVLVTGRGTSGSWKIRGEQLGSAAGATVMREAPLGVIADADIVVLVKRADVGLVERIHKAGKPLVLDVLDNWPQSAPSAMSQREAVAQMRSTIATFRPHAVIFATKRMQQDIAFEGPSICIPHHGRPNAVINPIREKVASVAYEGCERYLGEWKDIVGTACRKRGWEFRINPNALADADIAVAFRGNGFCGYQARHWKSNVKLANCQATGTPCVLAKESGYEETASGAEYWARGAGDLEFAFDWLTDFQARKSASEKLLAHSLPLAEVAEQYLRFLRRLC